LILAAVLAVIVIGIRLQSGLTATFFPLLLSVGIVAASGLYLGHPGSAVQAGILRGAGRVAIAVVVLLLVGALVGLWIAAGVIPTALDYGLRAIAPDYLLPTAFLVSVITSLATGTAYGTISTVGVALMGVSAGLGVHQPLAAGAILSGAFFGDKMSPLSDTTNIAAATGDVDLFRHIASMLYTTLPAAIICLVLFTLARGPVSVTDSGMRQEMLAAVRGTWSVGAIHLIPLLGMLALAAARIPALLVLFVSVLLAASWAVIFQGASFAGVFVAATSGNASDTGMAMVDSLMSRGGMSSMQPVIVLIVLAGALGGALSASGILEQVLKNLVRRVRTAGGLVVSVLAACYTMIFFTGNQGLALIIPGEMFRPAFRRHKIHNAVLTRTLEDAGTIAAPLVPWSAAGALATQMLGVPTLEYLPFVWLCFLVPIFSVTLAFTGIGVWPAPSTDEDKDE
jgi:NhaC family Na+:H+ antiporter